MPPRHADRQQGGDQPRHCRAPASRAAGPHPWQQGRCSGVGARAPHLQHPGKPRDPLHLLPVPLIRQLRQRSQRLGQGVHQKAGAAGAAQGATCGSWKGGAMPPLKTSGDSNWARSCTAARHGAWPGRAPAHRFALCLAHAGKQALGSPQPWMPALPAASPPTATMSSLPLTCVQGGRQQLLPRRAHRGVGSEPPGSVNALGKLLGDCRRGGREGGTLMTTGAHKCSVQVPLWADGMAAPGLWRRMPAPASVTVQPWASIRGQRPIPGFLLTYAPNKLALWGQQQGQRIAALHRTCRFQGGQQGRAAAQLGVGSQGSLGCMQGS